MIVKTMLRYAVALALAASTSVVSVASAQTAAPPNDAALRDLWRAPATTVVDSEEMAFYDGPVHLSGTLYYPRGRTKVPVVVVLHSAASATRDLSLYQHLKAMLPPLGMAVFVYDRRGSGKSSAGPKNAGFDPLVDDGIAARKMLARDPRIDASRTGYWGLSQGGWLALMAAAKDPQAAFVVSISAPMSTPAVQMNVASANILRVNGYSEADVEAALTVRRAYDDYMWGRIDQSTAQKAMDAARQQPWFKLIYLGNGTLEDPKTSSWTKEMGLDPLATLDQVRAPTLMLYGAVDPWTPVAVSEERLRATAAKHPNVQMVVIADADHTMNVSSDPKTQMDAKALTGEVADAPAYFAVLGAWLAQQHLVDLKTP